MSKELMDRLESTGYFKQYYYSDEKNESGEYRDNKAAILYFGFRLRDSLAQDEIRVLEEKLRECEQERMKAACDRNKAEFKLAIAIEALEKLIHGYNPEYSEIGEFMGDKTAIEALTAISEHPYAEHADDFMKNIDKDKA